MSMAPFMARSALSGIVKPEAETVARATIVAQAPVAHDEPSVLVERRSEPRHEMQMSVSIWEHHAAPLDMDTFIQKIQAHTDASIAASEERMTVMLYDIVKMLSFRSGSSVIVGDEDGPIDLQRLGQQFLDEEMKDETDKARRSTYKSAFGYWWKTVGLDVYPHEGKIEDFGVICRRAASEDYALARQRVMRKFRDWLEAKDIRRSPNEGIVPATPSIVPGAIPEAPTHDSVKWIVQIARDAIFGGEPSSDYWATLLRHVSSEIGASGIARMCNVDDEMAERWIQNGKTPKIAREKLKHAHLLLEIRKAKVESGKDLDDLWDEALEIEGFLSSGVGQDGL